MFSKGYGIVKSETKKGYAKEAALGIIEWAFKQDGIKTITANCSKENFALQKILAFLNFTKVEEDDEMIYWNLMKKPLLLLKRNYLKRQ